MRFPQDFNSSEQTDSAIVRVGFLPLDHGFTNDQAHPPKGFKWYLALAKDDLATVMEAIIASEVLLYVPEEQGHRYERMRL